jgi:hypothetical protein
VIYLPNVLIIGGTSRNAGKTSYICSILNEFSPDNHIYAAKITTHIHNSVSDNLINHEELQPPENKDTGRMKLAGAAKVYLIQCNENEIPQLLKDFIQQISDNDLWIIESNSLFRFIKPGLLIVLNKYRNITFKPSSLKLIHKADLFVEFEETNKFHRNKKIVIIENSWRLAP